MHSNRLFHAYPPTPTENASDEELSNASLRPSRLHPRAAVMVGRKRCRNRQSAHVCEECQSRVAAPCWGSVSRAPRLHLR